MVTDATDPAYNVGLDNDHLTLSVVAQNLGQTYCANCYIGTISAGTPATQEREVLRTHLNVGVGDLPEDWSTGCDSVTSPLVIACADGQKQNAIPGIVAWYADKYGAAIADEDITLFDDRESNIAPFNGLSYNGRQISCATRQDNPYNPAEKAAIGLCGATLAEISAAEADKGMHLCSTATPAQMV